MSPMSLPMVNPHGGHGATWTVSNVISDQFRIRPDYIGIVLIFLYQIEGHLVLNEHLILYSV